MTATITLEEYDEQVTRLHKKQGWEALEHYCQDVERQIRKIIRDGTATDDDKRLRIQVLNELQTVYFILDRPKEQLQAAQEAHRALQQVSTSLGKLDEFCSYKCLARAHAANDQAEKARDMFLRAGASVITRWQAEWLGNVLLDLAAFERESGTAETAATIIGLAEGIKRAARKVWRRGQRASQQADIVDIEGSDVPSPVGE